MKIKIMRAALVFLLAGAVGIAFWYGKDFSFPRLWEALQGSKLLSFAVLIGLYCAKTIVFFIPIYALFAGAGFLFSPPAAIAVSLAGLFLELTLGFILGRYLGKPYVKPSMERYKASKWLLNAANENSVFASFIIRLLPGPPTDLTNMFFGTLDMHYVKFMLASLGGIIPGMLPAIFLGNAVTTPGTKEFFIPLAVTACFSICSAAGYYRMKRNRKKQEEHI